MSQYDSETGHYKGSFKNLKGYYWGAIRVHLKGYTIRVPLKDGCLRRRDLAWFR